MKFYVTEKLSGKIARTPEGFLLCTDVVIARTGIQLYHVSELPSGEGIDWQAGENGVVKIHRKPEEVFRPETIASFNGKPIANDHPHNAEREINPTNWNELAVGVVLNPHRGTGAEDDVLFADLLVASAQAIEDVLSGKREVSCGYESAYAQTDPGEGMQFGIIGNHVALVEQGRCGARCSIGDAEKRGDSSMKVLDKLVADLKEAFAKKDEAKFKATADALSAVQTVEDEGSGMPAIHVHTGGSGGSESKDRKWTDEKLDEEFGKVNKMVGDNHKAVMDSLEDIKKGMAPKETDAAGEKEIEGELKEEAPPGSGDCAMKATDSQYLRDSYQDSVAKAEIIAPGIGVPTFDGAMNPKKTFLNICGLRRKALLVGNNDSVTNGIIEQVNGGKQISLDSLNAMSCGAVRTLFNGVAAVKSAKNTDTRTADVSRGTSAAATGQKPPSPAEINKRNRAFYGQDK